MVSSICALICADPALDLVLGAGAVDDRRVFLVDHDALGAAEHVQRDVLELDAEILADHLALGQDRDVLEHRLAAIAEARRLDGRHLEAAAQLVDDQGRQRLALDVLGHDQQRLAALDHGLEHRQQRLQVRELLLVDQQVGLLEGAAHLLGVGDEVGRDVAAVELHALDDVELGLEALGLLDRDHALVADLLHGRGQHLADLGVAIGRDRADLGDLFRGGDLLRARLQMSLTTASTARSTPRFRSIGFMPAATDFAPSRTIAAARMVAVVVPSPATSLVFEATSRTICAPMFSNLSRELDLLGDGHTVLGDPRRAEALLEHDVAALRAQRDLDRVVQDRDAPEHLRPGVGRKLDFLGSHL